MNESSFADLLVRLQAGEESAAHDIFQRYAHRLVGLASKKLVGLLRKCGYQVRQFLTDKRDLRREKAAADADSSASWLAIAREPTPAEAVALEDTLQTLLAGLDEKTGQIIELTLLGHEVIEIAPQVGLTERTVYRKLEGVKIKVRGMIGDKY
jgi:hypothetical protein